MLHDGTLIKRWEVFRSLLYGRPGDMVFYAAFAIVYLYRFYLTTMFISLDEGPVWLRFPAFAGVGILALLAGASLLDLIIHLDKEAWLIGIMLAAGFLSTLFGGWKETLVILCAVAAARGRNIRPVLLISLILGSLMMIAAYYASMNGYIPYLVYDTGGELLSHAFGIVYRTDFAAHVLYLVMLYAIMRSERMHLWEYMMLWLDEWIVWRYAHARADTLCLILFLTALGAMLAYQGIKGRQIRIPKWSAAVHAVCAAASFMAVAFFPIEQTQVISTADVGTLGARVNISRMCFQMYPINLFGHKIEERGAGGLADTSVPYFYIDISYVRILIVCGAAVFILYMLLITRASVRAVKQRQMVLALALIIVAVESIIEQHAFSLAYNVLILCSMGDFISGKVGQDGILVGNTDSTE